MSQLSLFDTDAAAPKDGFDKIMETLNLISEVAELELKLVTGLLDEIQKDWTAEEKEDLHLQVHDPKAWYKKQQLKNEQEKQDMAKEITTEEIEVLKRCSVDGVVVKLPEGQLERKIYLAVKNRLELIGGKWKGGKVQGFVFTEDPAELLAQIASGENRNLKKEYQFFGTPDELADRIVELAEIREEHVILEPSAGQGAIVKAVHRAMPGKNVSYCELMPTNNTIMQRMSNVTFVCEDFLTHKAEGFYDRIVANPPFAKNQDIDHIRHMHALLKPGGRLVSVASKHWQLSTNKKETQFRDWLDSVGASVEEVGRDAFKESGTTVPTVIITIDK